MSIENVEESGVVVIMIIIGRWGLPRNCAWGRPGPDLEFGQVMTQGRGRSWLSGQPGGGGLQDSLAFWGIWRSGDDCDRLINPGAGQIPGIPALYADHDDLAYFGHT